MKHTTKLAQVSQTELSYVYPDEVLFIESMKRHVAIAIAIASYERVGLKYLRMLSKI